MNKGIAIGVGIAILILILGGLLITNITGNTVVDVKIEEVAPDVGSHIEPGQGIEDKNNNCFYT